MENKKSTFTKSIGFNKTYVNKITQNLSNQSNNEEQNETLKSLRSAVVLSEIISEPLCKRRKKQNRW